ncbi:MAG: gliding motility-associated C-terminal domain-containing protein [Bacteroidia bacterium]|nr:gliding motility-associated C-terminal domain-containing protein [Bacteroidia bacterium]
MTIREMKIFYKILIFIFFVNICTAQEDEDEKNFSFINTCLGDSTEFIINNLAGIDSVFWYFDNHLSGSENTSVLFNPVHVFTSAGNYEVELIIFINGSYIIITHIVNVFNIPEAEFYTDTMTCYGKDILISYNYEVQDGMEFLWDFDDGVIIAGSDAGPYMINWLEAGEYYISLEVTQNGCIAISESVVYVPGPLNIDLQTENVLCHGDSSGSIAQTVSGGNGNYIYYWSENIPQTGNLDSLPAGLYYVTVTDLHQCTVATIATITEPNLPVTVTFSLSRLCTENETGNINITVTGGTPDYSYLWNDSTTNAYQNNIFPGQYDVTVTDQNGCKATETIYIDIYEPYQPEITTDVIAGCQPLTVAFNESGGGEVLEYFWYFNGDSIPDSYERNSKYTFINEGQYDIYLEVIDTNGCLYNDSVENMIKVYKKPVAAFSIDKTSSNVIEPGFHITSASQYALILYWDFGDGTTSRASEIWHSYITHGIYTIELIAESFESCFDTTSLTVMVNDVSTFYAPDAFTPNNDGTNDEFMLFTNGILKDYFYFAIYDRWGNLIFETQNIEDRWDGKNKRHVPVKSGVYKWFAVYRDQYNFEYKKSGEVTLIR